jgi:hypothetical protein
MTEAYWLLAERRFVDNFFLRGWGQPWIEVLQIFYSEGRAIIDGGEHVVSVVMAKKFIFSAVFLYIALTQPYISC